MPIWPKLLLKRAAFLAVVVFGVTAITFAISHLIPGDPARMLAGPRANAELVLRMRSELGLDLPLPIQYARYVEALAHGDLGTSIQTGRPVAEDLLRRVPATLELMLAALGTTLLIGIPLGVAGALRQGKAIDQIARGLSVLAVSTPTFWLGLMLLTLFYGLLDWAPSGGRFGYGDVPNSITGFIILDSLLTGRFTAAGEALRHLALPVATLTLVSVGQVVRIIRASMIEVLGEDYVRTARASGLSEFRVVFSHALPNALIPFVTVLGLAVAEMLYGAVVIETIFAWPGTGAYVVAAIFNLDFPAIMGFTFIASIFYVVVNLIVDLLYAALDPQMRAAI